MCRSRPMSRSGLDSAARFGALPCSKPGFFARAAIRAVKMWEALHRRPQAHCRCPRTTGAGPHETARALPA
jgi:hypothetical protein